MIYNNVINSIDRGRLGLNTGLPMGFDRLTEIIPGIQQGTYYLIGGETSSGKSSFVDSAFLFNPYDWFKSFPQNGIDLRIFYWSLEIDKNIKITKAICRKIYLEYGKLVDVNFVLSRGKKRISQEIYDLVVSTKDYFCELEDVLIVFDGSQNPTGINKYMVQFAKDNGDSIYQTKKSGSDTIDIFDKYIPYNPDQYVIIIIDHIALMKKERGFSIKENIDKMSEYLIGLRNRYNFIPVVVQQLSRSISTTDRFKLDKVEPQLSDFKDTSNTQQDANVVMGLFSPRRYEIGNFRGYDITRLKDRFRSLTVLKNRDGVADLRIGLQFIGEVGQFSEIPKAIEFEGNPDLYEEVINLKYKQKK